MTQALWFFLFAFPLALYWTSSRAAAERATHIGKKLCQQANVQWLDHSVHQVRLSVARTAHGKLAWRRVYAYEYSHGDEDRYSATITLLGLTAIGWTEPLRRSPI
jgi:hypothetical protein